MHSFYPFGFCAEATPIVDCRVSYEWHHRAEGSLHARHSRLDFQQALLKILRLLLASQTVLNIAINAFLLQQRLELRDTLTSLIGWLRKLVQRLVLHRNWLFLSLNCRQLLLNFKIRCPCDFLGWLDQVEFAVGYLHILEVQFADLSKVHIPDGTLTR